MKWFQKLRQLLNGYKVYLLAAGALIERLLAIESGEMGLMEFMRWVFEVDGGLVPLLLMAGRAAVAKAGNGNGKGGA